MKVEDKKTITEEGTSNVEEVGLVPVVQPISIYYDRILCDLPSRLVHKVVYSLNCLNPIIIR